MKYTTKIFELTRRDDGRLPLFHLSILGSPSVYGMDIKDINELIEILKTAKRDYKTNNQLK